jgi:hypothetical protein
MINRPAGRLPLICVRSPFGEAISIASKDLSAFFLSIHRSFLRIITNGVCFTGSFSRSVLLRPDATRMRRFFETEDGRRESEVGRPFVGRVARTHV